MKFNWIEKWNQYPPQKQKKVVLIIAASLLFVLLMRFAIAMYRLQVSLNQALPQVTDVEEAYAGK